MISGAAKLAGVIGWPVAHSRSPRLHGYWLERYSIDGAYVPLAVTPDDLPEALHALPRLGFRGANLTVPHKEAALTLVDSLSDTARRIGAVNTLIVHEGGTLHGDNTDAYGFLENLRRSGALPASRHAATIIGAGGAARAVAWALHEMGFATLRVVNRTPARAEALARALDLPTVELLGWNAFPRALENSDILVNTTTLGMEGQSPLMLDLTSLPTHALVTDIVYTPLVTPLLRDAAARGLATLDGLGMLLYQAQPGFEAWFGVRPEVNEKLREHVLRA